MIIVTKFHSEHSPSLRLQINKKLLKRNNLVNRICQDGDGAARQQRVRHKRHLDHFVVDELDFRTRRVVVSGAQGLCARPFVPAGLPIGPYHPCMRKPLKSFSWSQLLGTTVRGQRELNTNTARCQCVSLGASDSLHCCPRVLAAILYYTNTLF